MPSHVPLRVGIDLVDADEVRASLGAHGRRYLERIYTETERRDCGSDPARLAARFAAKEAMIKALALADDPVPWRDIGVVQDSRGRPSLKLTGEAAMVGARLGLRHVAVSLTHEGPLAAAIVFAEVSASR
jgi:holo-[acyl-carrier protein] synthase